MLLVGLDHVTSCLCAELCFEVIKSDPLYLIWVGIFNLGALPLIPLANKFKF
jgi:hypothetical protein